MKFIKKKIVPSTLSEGKTNRIGGVRMNRAEVKAQEVHNEDVESLRGTLFSSIVFVGGGIIAFILVLFYFYMTRI